MPLALLSSPPKPVTSRELARDKEWLMAILDHKEAVDQRRNSSLCMNRNKSARGLLPTWELASAADLFWFYFALISVKEVCHHKDGAPKTKSVKDKMDLQPPKAKGGQSPSITYTLATSLSRQGLIPALPSLLRVLPIPFQWSTDLRFRLDRGISILILSMIFSF